MVWFWDKLGNNKNNKNDPAFNLLKLNSDIKLPNTIIITAGFDPLCDDGEKYAYLLHKRGDNVKQLHYPNMFHGFVSSTRLNAAKIAVDDFLGEYKKII
jgi:acetyl esterase